MVNMEPLCSRWKTAGYGSENSHPRKLAFLQIQNKWHLVENLHKVFRRSFKKNKITVFVDPGSDFERENFIYFLS